MRYLLRCWQTGGLIGLMVLLSAMGATCNGGSLPGVPNCGPFSKASVLVTVTDAGGQELPGATINFTVNGGALTTTRCTGNCTKFPIIFGVDGQFNLNISAGGYVDASRTVTVPAGGVCGPETQDVIFVLNPDDTTGALAGAWETNTLFGRSILRFGKQGEVIGAILFSRKIAGDGNSYISYNNRPIQGVAGQPIQFIVASDPARTGNVFDFLAQTFGEQVGFQNATMSSDFATLIGTLPGLPTGTPVIYTRLDEIPGALRDPP